MSIIKKTNLEVAGGLLLLASGYILHWWQTRNAVPEAVKKEATKKDKEHAEELREIQEQRQKENQMFRSIIDDLINNKGGINHE